MFYADDSFYGSGPVLSIPREHRVAAVGLWTMAGTWSRHFLKDGFVPGHMIEELGGTHELAGMLVDVAKLWRRKGTGYQFNDWAKWQDTRAKIEKKRAEWRERQNRKRSSGPDNADPDPGDVTRDSPPPHPLPSPKKKTDDNDRPSSNHKSESAQVDNPVDDYPALLASTAAKLSSIAGEPISVAQAGVVVDRILERGGNRVRNPRRYVLGTLAQHGPEWLAFIIEGKEPE